ncbi:hypothetical protein GY664_00190 [Candidatus Liberibacter brunswickensis]
MLHLNWFDILIIALLCIIFAMNFDYLLSLMCNIIRYLRINISKAFSAIYPEKNTKFFNRNAQKVKSKKRNIQKKNNTKDHII